ncbi:hypothetical protein PHJA_001568100 [Phtheirospermum japonicum]|uniref:S-protein homolog n=1 Tax=Phtheirospermum japonicum TaxID=374723 RepID=A0A830C555_9LAMI|nr:hypothetical protein PHJA_001568100 [Phtheirospermum japonicum]
MLRSSSQFLIISTILLQATSLEENHFCVIRKFNVRVVDNIRPPGSAPLTLHCRSGDTDKGTHTLTTGQEFRFDFCVGFKPFFFCNSNLQINGKMHQNIQFLIINCVKGHFLSKMVRSEN